MQLHGPSRWITRGLTASLLSALLSSQAGAAPRSIAVSDPLGGPSVVALPPLPPETTPKPPYGTHATSGATAWW